MNYVMMMYIREAKLESYPEGGSLLYIFLSQTAQKYYNENVLSDFSE